jgi:hypothetical protein
LIASSITVRATYISPSLVMAALVAAIHAVIRPDHRARRKSSAWFVGTSPAMTEPIRVDL